MYLFSLLLLSVHISSPVDYVHPLHYEYSPGCIEITTAVAISPCHAVTIAQCINPADISIRIEGESVFPDTIYHGGDLGLSILFFATPLFSDYQLPEYVELQEDEMLRILGQGINGVVAIEETAGKTNDDGSVLIDFLLSDGYMGAAVFNQNGTFVGLITGLEYTSNLISHALDYSIVTSDNLVLYPTSIWYMWAQLIVNNPETADFRFGVTAMANATSGSSNSISGIRLLSVQEGSIAWNCGLRPGDIITELNGNPVYHPYTLRGLLLMSEDSIETVLQNGNTVRRLNIPTASAIY